MSAAGTSAHHGAHEERDPPTLEACSQMLQYVDPSIRHNRVRMGEALKDEFGDAAFEVFDAWYATHERYTAAESKQAWRSFGKGGGKPCTIGTLIYDATRNGFKANRSHQQKRTPEERARAEAEKQIRRAALAAEAAQEHAQAATRAVAIWNAADQDPAGHEYLLRKGIQAPQGIRRAREWVKEWTDRETGEVKAFRYQDALLIPIWSAPGKLASLQAILPSKAIGRKPRDGERDERRDKDYLAGGNKRGGYFLFGRITKDTRLAIFCEGFATGASLHEATGEVVVVCFDAGNLEPVATMMRGKLPTLRIVFAADNDRFTTRPDGSAWNPGVELATAAAKTVSGVVAVPPFDENVPGRPTDFNDLHAHCGLDAVRTAIDLALNPPATSAPAPAPTTAVEPGIEGRVADGEAAGADTDARALGKPEMRDPAEHAATAPASHDELTDQACAEPSTDVQFLIDPKAPLDVARQLIQRNWAKDGLLTIHRAGGTFYRWVGCRYEEVADEAVRAVLYRELDKARDFTFAPFKPDSAAVSKVEDALRAAAQLPGGRQGEFWVMDRGMHPSQEVVSMGNGLLHMPTRALLPHTPNFFCLNSLPFNYASDAPLPTEWLKFLNTVWPDDPDSIALLKCWFGYLISANTSFQKAMLLIGPPRSGKGTIAAVLKALLGGDTNVAGPRLSAFANNFGLEPLIGKRAAIVGDARLGAKIDSGEVVAALLSITGGDTLTVDRKNKDAWTGVLPARITICSNELPKLMDASGALASRFLVLQMQQSFLGCEDRGLLDRLLAELPGILCWGLDGWDLLKREGRFPTPGVSNAAIEALGELTSPVKAFIAESCEMDPAAATPCEDVFRAWLAWCKRQKRDYPGNLQSFGRDMSAAVSGLKSTRPRNGDGPRPRMYEGIRLLVPVAGVTYTDTFVWDEEEMSFIPVH